MIIAQLELFHVGSPHGMKTVVRIKDERKRFLSLSARSAMLYAMTERLHERIARYRPRPGLWSRIEQYVLNSHSRYLARQHIRLDERALSEARRSLLAAIDGSEPIVIEEVDRCFRMARLPERQRCKEVLASLHGVWVFCLEGDDLCSTEKLASLGRVI